MSKVSRSCQSNAGHSGARLGSFFVDAQHFLIGSGPQLGGEAIRRGIGDAHIDARAQDARVPARRAQPQLWRRLQQHNAHASRSRRARRAQTRHTTTDDDHIQAVALGWL